MKGYGFLSFAMNMKTQAISIETNFLRVLKIYSRCNKTDSKRATQKTAEATGYLIGNKIGDKIIKVSNELDSKI